MHINTQRRVGHNRVHTAMAKFPYIKAAAAEHCLSPSVIVNREITDKLQGYKRQNVLASFFVYQIIFGQTDCLGDRPGPHN